MSTRVLLSRTFRPRAFAVLEVSLEFKPQDLWVGVYWADSSAGSLGHTNVWVCLLPMLPIHVKWFRRRENRS